MRASRSVSSFLLLSAALGVVHAAVIQRIEGSNHSELAFLSAGGGTHVYLTGTGLGSAFAPPTILIGNAGAECAVQSFTSSSTRFHCVIQPESLPPPSTTYTSSGTFVNIPLRAFNDGRPAACWHVGGLNHACFVRIDLGATPRLNRILTPALEQGGLLRTSGFGINGGLVGEGSASVIGRYVPTSRVGPRTHRSPRAWPQDRPPVH